MTLLSRIYHRLFGYRCECGLRCKSQRGLTRHKRVQHERIEAAIPLPVKETA